MAVLSVSLFVLAVAWGALLAPPVAAAGPGGGAPPGVFAAPVRAVAFHDPIEALGTLRANESVAVTATITETITAIRFDDGDRVAAGQVLVEMTDNEEQALLQEARVTAAESRRQYERVKSLAAQGTASDSELDLRRREADTARARLAALESRLANHVVRAPFAGVVGLRNVSLGALVEPGDLITTLDDVSVMKLDFPVPAVHLDKLAPGLPVEAVSAAFPGRVFRGEVKSLDSRVDPVTRSIRVRALIPNPEGLLRPGLLLRVMVLRDARQALVVPEAALIAQGEDHFVLVVGEGDTLERRKVTVGSRRVGEAEVVAGLRPGERVVTDGSLKVRPGQKVTVRAVDGGETLADLLGQASPARQP